MIVKVTDEYLALLNRATARELQVSAQYMLQHTKMEKLRRKVIKENYLVEEGKKGNNIDIIIFKTLQNGALTSKQILQKTNLDWSTRKLTDYLKTKKEIQVLNKKPLKFQLKNLSYQTKLFV